MNDGHCWLEAHELTIAVGECVLVEQLSLALRAGSITAVLGRNGTGKSLTLRTLAGLRPVAHGSIHLNNRPLLAQSRRQIAQTLSFVAQESDEPFPVTVLECAVSGRHPHLNFWAWESPADYELARHALSLVDMNHFANRQIDTLSGGERRRLAMATALTQDTRVYLLDEPTNHLDPQHQLQVLHVMQQRARAGCAVLMSLHDPNLALRFADQALLLFGDGRWLCGPSGQILTTEHLQALYRVPMLRVAHAGGSYVTPC